MENEEMKIRFLGLYLFQEFTHPELAKPEIVLGVSRYSISELYEGGSVFCTKGWFDTKRCKPVLKPLSEISDEDAVECANMVAKGEIGVAGLCAFFNGSIPMEKWIDPTPSWKVKTYKYDEDENGEYWTTEVSLSEDTLFKIMDGGQTMSFHWRGEAMPIDNVVFVVDFLRSKGYALPYMGKDPFAEGWAVPANVNQPEGATPE